MDEILLTKELAEGALEGEFEDGYRWQAEISRLEQAEEEVGRLPYDSLSIKVDIGWDIGGREKHFAVDTMKIVEKVSDQG